MGLDMYLEKRHYVKNWSHDKPKDKWSITIKKGGKLISKTKIDPSKITYLIEDAGTWRKANAIHNWFVNNVQEGNDDCKSYYVSTDDLQELLDLVNKVLKTITTAKGKVANGYSFKDGKQTPILEDGITITNPKVCEKLLPTQEGFFFGMTGYDQYYIEDLKYTKKILMAALKDKEAEFYYQSSW